MTANLRCSECGSREFISQPDRYSIYEAEGNKLRLVSSEMIDDEIRFYCRDCSAELDVETIEFASPKPAANQTQT